MAEENKDKEDKTEEATPERREEFREKGQVAVSKEITSVLILASLVTTLSFYFAYMVSSIIKYLRQSFEGLKYSSASPYEFKMQLVSHGIEIIKAIGPLFIVGTTIAIFGTFIQTRMNFSWKRLEPNFKRMNPLTGLVRMFSWQAVIELIKGLGKMSAVGIVGYLILYSEWTTVPGLMEYPIVQTWIYWAEITKILFWAVAGLMVFVAAIDYTYNWFEMEKQLKMTKQEVKEEFKKRESDPHVKARMKRMQRDISMAKAVKATKTATAVITNPTHYAVAIKYEMGMTAPVVVAKGKELTALRMREVAVEFDIPIVENKPLARTLFKIVKVGEEIPESLYQAVSEVIRYVFSIKGRK
ncbi:MAG: EscU/YscU/HrcU family type III secretion system export apparatus switch protein [Pseudobacteriovorax sp.]|nr:EscU/YscU/HrcU family type III secretion system export apparatus switch protein [Pseudobacteriovorax sp.]